MAAATHDRRGARYFVDSPRTDAPGERSSRARDPATDAESLGVLALPDVVTGCRGGGGDRATIHESPLRRLLRREVPSLAELPLRHAAGGWDNDIWRLGDDLALRLTRRAVAAELHVHEQTWLPIVASRLPIPVPTPVFIGGSSPDYPLPWSVVPWYEGDVAAVTPPVPGEARTLGRFMAALHTSAPDGAPHNPVRGVPLVLRRQAVWASNRHEWAAGDRMLTAAATRVFDAGVAVSPARDRVWLHGDLHSRNILINRGRLAAVLDWGDMTAGDAATNLAAVWWLFDLAEHSEFWEAYRQIPAATWHRARAWAGLFGLSFLTFALPGVPNTPDLKAHKLARQLLERVVAEQRSFGNDP